MNKRAIHFNEYNVLMDGATYFPLVSGILRSYASQFGVIQEHYRFAPFLFYRGNWEEIVAQYKNPSIAAFSVSMWNEQLSLKVARTIKEKFPGCLIVFGGPHVPHHPAEYFTRHPFIDVAVRGEGEEAFAEILIRFLETIDFRGIAGVAYRDPVTKTCVRNETERPQPKDLDIYPSPYLSHCFDDLIVQYPQIRFQAIIETNRGCPFPCAFCFWGQGGLSRKYRFHSLERVRDVIEWCGQNRIEYVFNADSNFGMHPRDYQIAEFLVEAKKKHRYPDKFRTCFGKNTDDKIYKVAKLLHDYGMEKGITLARQSNDETTLANINRQNIKLETYRTLQTRFNEDNIPVYTELILGLPGETCESWLKGIDDILNTGIKNQLFVYHAQVYPNTEFGDVNYQKKFGMEVTRIPLNEIHGAIRPGYLETEFEYVITRTNSLSRADWKRLTVFSWVMQLFHSLKLAYFVMMYLHKHLQVSYSDFLAFISEKKMSGTRYPLIVRCIETFERHADDLLMGHGRGRILPEYGAIYWDEEEAVFLRLSEEISSFYDELCRLAGEFLDGRNIEYVPGQLKEVIEYQRIRIPVQNGCPRLEPKTFHYNLPEFFEKCFTLHQVPMERREQVLLLDCPRDFGADQKEYAKQIILWGRKSGNILQPVRWQDVQTRQHSPQYSLAGS